MPITDENELSLHLAEGRITALTVDTNIFDEKGLQMNSPALRAIVALEVPGFSFILSGTVAQEIRRHMVVATEAALQAAKKTIGVAISAFETTNPTRDALLAQISGGRTAIDAAEERFAAFVVESGCELLDDAAHVDTATIYNAYFAGEPPFGNAGKKNEFPDALALYALEAVAADRQTEIIVVSKDGDWRSFCEASARLHLIPDVERALSLINNVPIALREAIQRWLDEYHDGREELTAHLKGEVELIDFSVNGHPSSGEMEAMTWSGEITKVIWPEVNEIDLIEVGAAEAGVRPIKLSVPLQIIVRVPVELSFSVWDSVDRESVGMGGRMIEVDEELDLRATISVKVRDPGGEDEDIEFIDCEIDVSSHDLDIGNVEVFEREDYE